MMPLSKHRLAASLLAASLYCAACEPPSGPRRAPYPTVDPRGAFPQLAETLRDAQRSSDLWIDEECGGDPSGEFQLLVGGGLAVNLPNVSWKVMQNPNQSQLLIRHEQSGNIVSWVFIEEMKAEGVAGLRDFLSRLDPGLATPLPEPAPADSKPESEPVAGSIVAGSESTDRQASSPDLEDEALSEAVAPELPPGDAAPPPAEVATEPLEQAGQVLADAVSSRADAVREVLRAVPRTGYESTSGSFTGWRWVGRCENDARQLPLLRLARTTGIWRHGRAPRAAHMLVGSATLGPRTGVYLAIVTVTNLASEDALHLAELLASLHAGHQNGSYTPRDDAQVFGQWLEEIGLAPLDSEEPPK